MNQKFKLIDIKLIIGLGNPGTQYKNTYHNAGHLFIDYLKNNCQLPIANCQLLKTDCFMNESGNYIARCIQKYKTKSYQLLVIHDDTDCALGTYKLQFGRGSAGHKGIESIIQKIGTKEFWRLRIGMRPFVETRREKAEQFVLHSIAKKDKIILNGTFKSITTGIFPDSLKN